MSLPSPTGLSAARSMGAAGLGRLLLGELSERVASNHHPEEQDVGGEGGKKQAVPSLRLP